MEINHFLLVILDRRLLAVVVAMREFGILVQRNRVFARLRRLGAGFQNDDMAAHQILLVQADAQHPVLLRNKIRHACALPFRRQPAAPEFGQPFPRGAAHLGGGPRQIHRPQGVQFAQHEFHAAGHFVIGDGRARRRENIRIAAMIAFHAAADIVVDEMLAAELQIAMLVHAFRQALFVLVQVTGVFADVVVQPIAILSRRPVGVAFLRVQILVDGHRVDAFLRGRRHTFDGRIVPRHDQIDAALFDQAADFLLLRARIPPPAFRILLDALLLMTARPIDAQPHQQFVLFQRRRHDCFMRDDIERPLQYRSIRQKRLADDLERLLPPFQTATRRGGFPFHRPARKREFVGIRLFAQIRQRHDAVAVHLVHHRMAFQLRPCPDGHGFRTRLAPLLDAVRNDERQRLRLCRQREFQLEDRVRAKLAIVMPRRFCRRKIFA